MNILHANFHFSLPDDFNGSMADALRLLIEYLDEPPKHKDRYPISNGEGYGSFQSNLRYGFRFTGRIVQSRLTEGMWASFVPECNAAHSNGLIRVK